MTLCCFCLVIVFFFLFVRPHDVEDPLPAALQSRAEEFKSAVGQLVDLLDLNQPSTARLKVSIIFKLGRH